MPPAITSEPEPKIVVLPGPDGVKVGARKRWRYMAGLLWCEWYAHSRMLIFFLAAWLVSAWILPLYANPAFILLLGGLFAIIAGPIYGGADTMEGCEEFTFALPPTRSERYLARLVLGGGALLLLTVIDLLALGLDLPQILAKLYVGSGLIRPWPAFRSGLLYGLVLVLPTAVFSISFVISALTHSRAVLLSVSLWAILVSLALLRLGFWYEEFVWEKLNGWFSCPLLAIVSILVLVGGGVAYRRKEVGFDASPLPIPGRWWIWLVVFSAGAAAAMTFAASLVRHYLRVFGGG